MTKLRLILTTMLALAPTMAIAARITTQDGSVITGDILSLQNGVYTVKTLYGTATVPSASVRSIDNAPPQPVAEQPPQAPSTGPLRLAGSTTIGDELAPALLEAYASFKGAGDVTWTQEAAGPSEQLMEGKGTNNAAFTAHLSRHGSGTAFTALQAGQADIGMASRRINDKEIADLEKANLGEFAKPGLENVLALDGLIVAVNQSNPVTSLQIGQIRDLFSGKVTDWSQVGGKPGPVHLIGRDDKSGTFDTFNALVMSGTHLAGDVAVVPGNDEVAEKIQGDPQAIGYVGFAYLRSNKALNIVTDCGLEYPAEDIYVRTEEYPLARRLYLYAPANRTNVDTQPFLDFALGPQGQDLARKKNFIDLVPTLAANSLGRNDIALDIVSMSSTPGTTSDDLASFLNYARHIVNGNRVSTTFRFQTGSAELDARAVRDIDRLADYLKSSPAGHRHLLVAGFSDSIGAANKNKALSQNRARTIADLLMQKGVQPNDVIGFGRIAPVACNSNPQGLEKNRRVEIWVY